MLTLRLTVCEVFAVKWPKFMPKISDLIMVNYTLHIVMLLHCGSKKRAKDPWEYRP